MQSTHCPLDSAHKRLLDAHDYWHEAAENYMDPRRFRRAMNTCIQELRNITFLIQKQKRLLAEFDIWYGKWRAEAQDDRVMRWIVDSRNRIVKEADLELLSVLRVNFHLAWDLEVRRTYPFPPSVSLEQAVNDSLRQLWWPSVGFLRVSRSWVDVCLGGVEILDALGYAFQRCLEIHEIAREAAQCHCHAVRYPASCLSDSDVPDCVINGGSYRELDIDLSARETRTVKRIRMARNDAELEEALSKYGEPSAEWVEGGSGGALESVGSVLGMGLQILAVDEDLMCLIILYRNGVAVSMNGTEFLDHHSKVQVADTISSLASLYDADGVLVSADSWVARSGSGDPMVLPVSDRDDKMDALLVSAVCRDGRSKQAIARYRRLTSGELAHEVEFGKVDRYAIFEPLRKLWQIDHWEPA